jgi:hypothetical protein
LLSLDLQTSLLFHRGFSEPLEFKTWPPPKLKMSCVVTVNESYARICPRKCTQPFQAHAATGGSGVIPAMWADAVLEGPGEVARIAGQQNWRWTVDQKCHVIVGMAGR